MSGELRTSKQTSTNLFLSFVAPSSFAEKAFLNENGIVILFISTNYLFRLSVSSLFALILFTRSIELVRMSKGEQLQRRRCYVQRPTLVNVNTVRTGIILSLERTMVITHERAGRALAGFSSIIESTLKVKCKNSTNQYSMQCCKITSTSVSNLPFHLL